MWYSMRSMMIEKKTMTTMEQQTFFLDSYDGVCKKRRVKGVFIFRVLKVRLELCLFSFFFLFATFRVFCVWTTTLLSSME